MIADQSRCGKSAVVFSWLFCVPSGRPKGQLTNQTHHVLITTYCFICGAVRVAERKGIVLEQVLGRHLFRFFCETVISQPLHTSACTKAILDD